MKTVNTTGSSAGRVESTGPFWAEACWVYVWCYGLQHDTHDFSLLLDTSLIGHFIVSNKGAVCFARFSWKSPVVIVLFYFSTYLERVIKLIRRFITVVLSPCAVLTSRSWYGSVTPTTTIFGWRWSLDLSYSCLFMSADLRGKGNEYTRLSISHYAFLIRARPFNLLVIGVACVSRFLDTWVEHDDSQSLCNWKTFYCLLVIRQYQ